ncbi:MAG: zinc ribbon domain-containing protein [Acidobacteriota bacterium]
MYCPSCGAALAKEMSYCNRCGLDLSAIKGGSNSKSLEKSIESIIWSIVMATATVLGIMVAVMALMKGFELGGEVVIVFMALMFLILLGIDGVLIWQLKRLNSLAIEARSASQLERHEIKDLGAKRDQALIEPRMSVTENTTRRLEPTYEERKTK